MEELGKPQGIKAYGSFYFVQTLEGPPLNRSRHGLTKGRHLCFVNRWPCRLRFSGGRRHVYVGDRENCDFSIGSWDGGWWKWWKTHMKLLYCWKIYDLKCWNLDKKQKLLKIDFLQMKIIFWPFTLGESTTPDSIPSSKVGIYVPKRPKQTKTEKTKSLKNRVINQNRSS